MPKPWHCIKYQTFLNQIQTCTAIWISMTRTDGTIDPNLVSQPENVNIKSIQQYYENTTYSSIAYWMQSSILFCCTETNNILRAVSSSEDAVFSIRTFTWSWCLPDSEVLQICVGLNIESSGLQDWPTLAFEADICTRWKGIPVQWFSEFYFYFFLRILATGIVFFIDVIDLSHQIIEFSKNRDDGYYKMLIWNLKDERYKPFPALALLKNSVSSGNRGQALFRTKQNLLPQNWPSVTSMYAEIAKLTK